MEKSFTKAEIVDAVERLKRQEREDCDGFCLLNSGKANDERRWTSSVILAALNTVLYEFDALNI